MAVETKTGLDDDSPRIGFYDSVGNGKEASIINVYEALVFILLL